MDAWVLWLIVGVVLLVGEALTMGFFLAPFAAGALVACIAAAAGAGTAIQLAAALVVSVLALTTLRPLARSHLRTPPSIRTGTAALVGKQALVTERITQDDGGVKLDGEHWSARPYIDGQVFEAGDRVHVVQIRGATALVSE